MSGSLIEVMMENERSVNRSCAIGILWIAAVCAVICLVGSTGALFLSPKWMWLYVAVNILPNLAVAAYAKRRDYRGFAIRHLMVIVAALVPASMAVPSIFGFLLMPLPIVVAGRYFSRRFVWHAYGAMVVLSFLLLILHARFGIPCYPLCAETVGEVQAFLSGQDPRVEYWRDLVVWFFPSFALCLSFFAITMSRLCRSHLDALERQAKVNARLADVEKGLAIAATMEFMRGESAPVAETATVRTGDVARAVADSSTGAPQPKVGDWSTTRIVKCISRCKERAAEDPEFAALVERDPAAAVREVQG